MTAERLWGWQHAFDHAVTQWIALGCVSLLLLAAAAIVILSAAGAISPPLRRELWLRTASWAVIIPLLIVPVLAGAGWTIAATTALALLCYNEYARVTGLFRERIVSAFVVLGILFQAFAALDHWYGFFVAITPLAVGLIAICSIPLDRPGGYIQRVGLAVFAFLLFGSALGHLAYMANDWHYRPLILLILLAVGLNDVFAFCVGKSLGGPKLLPHTSPNKTVSGAAGALVLTTMLVALLSGAIFVGTPLEALHHRVALGVLISVFGQLGDLMLSSIKRDLG
ncbi:MAG TPA: phosphatidate cytidylyltransferase, partial [Alphaproteobacteria bacterium]|nr:phosphatidate cytidylyltransferase [Alphaproteobacteria bacterium]